MLLILCGCSCSGKNAVIDTLSRLYGYHRVLTVTDRLMRPEERNGVDYEFVSPEVFDNLLENDYFLETTSFEVAVGENVIWRYGTPKSAFTNKISDKTVIIMNPRSIKKLSRLIMDNQCCICQISANEQTIRERQRMRGDNPEEAKRRLRADIVDLQNLSPSIVVNNNYGSDIEQVAKSVHESYLLWKAGK